MLIMVVNQSLEKQRRISQIGRTTLNGMRVLLNSVLCVPVPVPVPVYTLINKLLEKY